MRHILGLILVILFLVALLGATTPYFLTKANMIVLVDNMALEAVALSGYTLLLVGGFFDLSVDGVVGLSGITAGLLMSQYHVPWPLASCISLVLASCVGMLNGIIVARVKVNGLIATLTTWWICIGISLGMTGAVTQYGFPEGFQLLGQARFFDFRCLVIYAIVAVAISSIALHWTPAGAHIYISGDNRRVAELMGIDTARLGIAMYTLVGLLAGFIGLVVAARMNAATTMAVDGMTLRVIAASVIGGANLKGGKGSVVGGLLGLCIMHILSNSIIQLGISPYWQKAVLGGALLAAVLTRQLRFRRNRNVQEVQKAV